MTLNTYRQVDAASSHVRRACSGDTKASDQLLYETPLILNICQTKK